MKRDKNMAKYVIRMLPEYMATCLWPVSDNAYDDLGIPIDYETLHLSEKLTEELKRIDDDVLDIVDWSDPHNESSMSKEERYELLNRGKKLLELIRAELGPDFDVQDDLDWIVAEFKI